MTGVLITIDITLQSSVQSDYSQSTNHLWRISYLALTQREMFREIVYIIIYHLQTLIGNSHSRSRGIDNLSFHHMMDSSILYHLAIDMETRYQRTSSKSFEYGVTSGTDTTLDRQEL